MARVETVLDRVTKAAAIELGKRLSARMMELGLSASISARMAFSGCVRIAPSLVMSDEELEKGLSIMEEAFKTTEGSMKLLEWELSHAVIVSTMGTDSIIRFKIAILEAGLLLDI